MKQCLDACPANEILQYVPFRFLESELDVHDEIQKLHVIATAPELYSILVQQNAIQTMLGLLSHENSGILSHASLANFCLRKI